MSNAQRYRDHRQKAAERAEQLANLENANALLREENAEFIAMLEADSFRLDVIGRRLATVEAAIRTHRLSVWGGNPVERAEDRELYAVLRDDKDQGILVTVADRTIEVYQKDAPTLMTWHDAVTWCESLGDEWRLPTKEELNEMYGSQADIGGFASDIYWSSSENDNDFAWSQSFYSGNQYYYGNKNFSRRVRAVRSVK